MAERFGSYEILRKLASGGMAEVYLAKQTGLGGFERLVCIKRILPHLGEQDEFITMFMDEARIAANLIHPNIAQIYDIGEADASFYIAMEYVRGEDVRKIYNGEVQRGRPIPPQQAAQIVMYAAAGLDYAHRKTTIDGRPMGIVHRDVSPQNILVSYDGHVKVVDFGVAKAANKMNETRSGVLKGKYSYMSPEQASGDPIDARTDIFALGITLYEVTTGTRLFKRENELETLHAVIACEVKAPREVLPEYDPGLEEIVMRCLKYDPDERFSTAGDLERELERYLIGKSHPTSASSLGQYMQDLFADKLADELLFGSQPWQEDDTGKRGTRKVDSKPGQKDKSDQKESRRRNEARDEARKDEDERTEVSSAQQDDTSPPETNSAGPLGLQSPWDAASESRESRPSRSSPSKRAKNAGDWSYESRSASKTATQRESLDLETRVSEPNEPPAPSSARRREIAPPPRPSRTLTAIAIAAFIFGIGGGVALVISSKRGGDSAHSGPVLVDSEPRGARVVFIGHGSAALNERYQGHRTPFTIAEGLPVEVPLRLRYVKEGFELTELNVPTLSEAQSPPPLFSELRSSEESAQEGTLTLLTNPPGAEVYIDGNKIAGRTPLSEVRVSGGESHRVEFHLPGHEPRFETLFVEKGARRFIEQTLVPGTGKSATPAPTPTAAPAETSGPEMIAAVEPTGVATDAAPRPSPAAAPDHDRPTAASRDAYLTVTATLPLKVTVGSRQVGETPVRRLSLDPGVHNVKLESESEGFIVRRKVRLSGGRAETLDIRPKKGSMSLNATPWAWVRLGERAPAETPIRLEAYEGEYTVVFECPDGNRKRLPVRVAPGQTTSASVNCRE